MVGLSCVSLGIIGDTSSPKGGAAGPPSQRKGSRPCRYPPFMVGGNGKPAPSSSSYLFSFPTTSFEFQKRTTHKTHAGSPGKRYFSSTHPRQTWRPSTRSSLEPMVGSPQIAQGFDGSILAFSGIVTCTGLTEKRSSSGIDKMS